MNLYFDGSVGMIRILVGVCCHFHGLFVCLWVWLGGRSGCCSCVHIHNCCIHCTLEGFSKLFQSLRCLDGSLAFLLLISASSSSAIFIVQSHVWIFGVVQNFVGMWFLCRFELLSSWCLWYTFGNNDSYPELSVVPCICSSWAISCAGLQVFLDNCSAPRWSPRLGSFP